MLAEHMISSCNTHKDYRLDLSVLFVGDKIDIHFCQCSAKETPDYSDLPMHAHAVSLYIYILLLWWSNKTCVAHS